MCAFEPIHSAKAIQPDFPDVPVTYITKLLKDRRTLYEGYRAIEAAQRTEEASTGPEFRRLKKPRKRNQSELCGLAKFPDLKRELEAVRRRCNREEGTPYPDILQGPLSPTLDASVGVHSTSTPHCIHVTPPFLVVMKILCIRFRSRSSALRVRQKAEAEAAAAAEKRAFETGDVMECACCFTDTPSAQLTATPMRLTSSASTAPDRTPRPRSTFSGTSSPAWTRAAVRPPFGARSGLASSTPT